MIKVGIIGASNNSAGELIRLLVNHPEVEISMLQADGLGGRPVSSCHHGLIGENIVNIEEDCNPDNIDIIFNINNSDKNKDIIINRLNINPGLRYIEFPDLNETRPAIDKSIGLSEINRKELVRGSRIAKILPPQVALLMIALYPLLNYLISDKEIIIEVAAPKDVADNIDTDYSIHYISLLLSSFNANFNAHFSMKVYPNKSERVMRVRIITENSLTLEEISDLYEGIYDDHNFVFQTWNEIEGREIEGTHKTLINIKKPTTSITEIEIVGDCRLRGGAGDAIHVMNLFFSLYEKVGLQLKPSRFGGQKDSTSRPENWLG